MPGLAIAEAMRSRGWQVHWLATRHGIENRLVPASGIPMTRLNFSGLRGKGLKHSVLGVLKLAVATHLSGDQPDCSCDHLPDPDTDVAEDGAISLPCRHRYADSGSDSWNRKGGER